MSASVKLEGFDELVRELTHAPQAIRDEAMQVIREETEGAAVEIDQRYPRKTGNLAKRVKTSYPSSTVLVGIVQSTSPHAHIYEFGTSQRKTDAGANRGVMPAHKVTPLIAQKHRDRMLRRLTDLVKRFGFQVGG